MYWKTWQKKNHDLENRRAQERILGFKFIQVKNLVSLESKVEKSQPLCKDV
jgi:hypothetical protein